MRFLEDAWYQASWSEEVSSSPRVVRVIDQLILIFRTAEGKAVALSAVCPHRFAPLVKGRLTNDTIQCPYHGLKFDFRGKCVLNPHGVSNTDECSHLRSYPLVEKFGGVWVWMGDSNRIEYNSLPAFTSSDFSSHVFRTSGCDVDANYELLNDNLLDLSHSEFLHPNLSVINQSDGATTEISQNGNVLMYRRKYPPLPPTSFHKFLLGSEPKYITRESLIQWYPPGNILLTISVAPDGGPTPARAKVHIAHIITPQSAKQSLYFFAIGHHNEIAHLESTKAKVQMNIDAFINEDKPMVEAQQQFLGDRDILQMQPIGLETDGAPARARHIIGKLINISNALRAT